MAGFPKVPLIRGDTDDDASIHLHTHVGPARPMTKRNYDRQIMEILNRRPLRPSSDDELMLDLEDLNSQFENFSKQRRGSDYLDDEDTEVEDLNVRVVQNDRPPKQKKSYSSPPEPLRQHARYLIDLRIIGFIFGIILLLLIPIPRIFEFNRLALPPQDISSVNARIGLVEQRILALDDIAKALSDQTDSLESKQEAFITSIIDKMDEITRKFDSIANNDLFSSQFKELREEFNLYKSKLDDMEVVLSDSDKLEANLTSISHKLSQLTRISDDIAAFKEDIIGSFILALPDYVPVYIKDKKIHYLPEFQKFLHAFVDKFTSKKLASPNFAEYYSQLEMFVKKQIASDMKGPLSTFISRDELQRTLNERIAESNTILTTKLNAILDKVDLSGNITRIDVEHATNKVMLDNLVDVVSKGSVKMNFADYKNGARILGFLTTTGRDSYKQKSLARRIFLGWYDYLDSNGLRSPHKLVYDANNLLVDMGTYWKCETNACSFGVRLSSPVILTDLIFKNPSQLNQDIALPTRASIYVKPSKRSQVAKLQEYLNRVKPEFLRADKDNKYLTKFFKIQEVNLKARPVEHVKLPVSLINMKIIARDIYIEIASQEGFTTGLYNLKAYGITEFNSLAYAEEFDSILDNLHEESTNFDGYRSFEDGKILGDDDYI